MRIERGKVHPSSSMMTCSATPAEVVTVKEGGDCRERESGVKEEFGRQK